MKKHNVATVMRPHLLISLLVYCKENQDFIKFLFISVKTHAKNMCSHILDRPSAPPVQGWRNIAGKQKKQEACKSTSEYNGSNHQLISCTQLFNL